MIDYDKEGCPDGMYPCDSRYDENEYDNWNDFVESAEGGADVLNYPISWFISQADPDFETERTFRLVFIMPRKGCDTWSITTTDFDTETAVRWVKDYTRRAATEWYGWDEQQ